MTNADKAEATVDISDASFAATALSGDRPVLVEFWAPWCPRCRMAAPVLDAIATELAGRLTIAKLDVDANPVTTREFQIVATPTLILFKDGQAVRRIVGAKAKGAYLRELSEALPDLA